jgi:hypothetical protein
MQALISIYVISIVTVVAIAAYLLPILVAWLRHSPDLGVVIVIDLCLGWTLIGWLIALTLALRKPASPAVQVINQVNNGAHARWPQ